MDNMDNIDDMDSMNELTFINEQFNDFDKISEGNNHITQLKIINCQLSIIKKLPNNLKKLILRNSELEILDKSCIPKSLIHLDLHDNVIKNLEFITENIMYLSLSKNCINSVKCNKNNLIDLVLDDNMIRTLDDLPYMPQLNLLSIAKNGIKNIDILEEKTPNLTKLNIADCDINKINKLPSRLVFLNAENNEIKKILCKFPCNLEVLNLKNNKIKDKYPDIPQSVKYLDMSFNNLIKYDYIHIGVAYIDIRNNKKLSMNQEQISKINHIVNYGCEIYYDNNDNNLNLNLNLNHNHNHNHNLNHNHNHNHNHSNKNKLFKKKGIETDYELNFTHIVNC
jgi:hypothetical protein